MGLLFGNQRSCRTSHRWARSMTRAFNPLSSERTIAQSLRFVFATVITFTDGGKAHGKRSLGSPESQRRKARTIRNFLDGLWQFKRSLHNNIRLSYRRQVKK